MNKRLSSIFTNGLFDKETRAQQDGLSPATLTPPTSSTSPENPRARSPGRLYKSQLKARRSFAQLLTPTDHSQQPSLQSLKEGLEYDDELGQSDDLPPPPPIAGAGTHSRSSSVDRSRPGTPGRISRSSTPKIQVTDQSPNGSTTDGGAEKLRKKRTVKHGKPEEAAPFAWVVGHPKKVAYDAQALSQAKPMPELWNEMDGNCFVFLFPRTSAKGPSFKIDSAVFASSPMLTKLAFGDIYSSQAIVDGDRKQMPLDARTQHLSMSDPATPPMSPKYVPGGSVSDVSQDSRRRISHFVDVPESNLYLPIKMHADAAVPGLTTPQPDDQTAIEDLQTMIDYRNFFAFLTGQSLVATERRPSLFQIFMTISGILRSFQFGNVDGSTYGEAANTSFEKYVEELGLADVRASREKTIEGIVLGERMKSVALYNEAFTHGVGRYHDIMALKSPKYELITPITQNRLARASMDLDQRMTSIRSTLTQLEFPTLFAGIIASKSSAERKLGVRFEAWKEGFSGMRKFMLLLMKQRYGDWPPKASSKKNSLETSGLNRLVLRDLYDDMSCLYDLLVDRTHLTTRTIDGFDLAAGRDSPTIRGLRIALSEYDRSSPPVKPPIPFDLPRFPTLRTTRTDFGIGDARTDAKAAFKKLKAEEIAAMLRAAGNADARSTPFLETFREMERRAGNNCTLAELEDLRVGQWLFTYVCLQALPMLALDAPGLKWTTGVEYFLCEPPRSGVPWADPTAAGSGAGQRRWFSVGGAGGGVVSLPSDLVEHGVEGIYRRSHCWRMAEQWTAENPILNEALHEQQQLSTHHEHAGEEDADGSVAPGLRDPTQGLGLPPPMSLSPSAAWHPDSPGMPGVSRRHSSLALGLEALPLPAGVTPDGRAPTHSEGMGRRTPRHSVDTSKTFDTILGPPPPPPPPEAAKPKRRPTAKSIVGGIRGRK